MNITDSGYRISKLSKLLFLQLHDIWFRTKSSSPYKSKIYYKEDKYGNKEKYRVPVRNNYESIECTCKVALPTHTLVLSHYKYRLDSDWICNKCIGKFPSGTERWFCQLCNNDICVQCFN